MRLFTAAVLLSLLVTFTAHSEGYNVVQSKLPPPEGGREKAPGYYQRKALRNLNEGAAVSVDSLKMLVIRVAFQDRDFSMSPQVYPSHDSLYFENELRHLSEYYRGASLNRFRLDSDLYGRTIRVSRPESYYGAGSEDYNRRMVEMMMEVVDSTDSRIDFSEYGTFAIIHAGAGKETDIFGDSPNQIWSGFIDPDEAAEALSDTLGTPGVPTGDTVNGDTFYVDNFLILPETSSQDGMTFGSLGIYAFQMGKRLGMLPMYDSTPSGFTDSQGIGNFGLMSYGLYNALGIIPSFPCGFNRYLMGWVEPVVIRRKGPFELEGINQPAPHGARMARIDIGSAEYFLLVNRDHDPNFNGIFDFGDLNGDGIPQNEDTLQGAEFDFFITQETNPYSTGEDGRRRYLTGSGIMIWHVDERVITQALSSGDFPNDNRNLKGVDLEEADGVQDLDRPGGDFSFGSYYDSFREGNRDKFGINTIPSSISNSGFHTGIEISDISLPDTVMSLYFSSEVNFPVSDYTFGGSVGLLSPVAVAGDDRVDLVMPASPGMIYLFENAGISGWQTRARLLADFDRAEWQGSAVAGDLDGLSPVIFAVSVDGELCAVRLSGDPFPIDLDGTEGVLDLGDSIITLPLMIDLDEDTLSEAVILSSSSDSIYFNVVGADIFGGSHEIGNGVLRAGKDTGCSIFSSPSAGRIIMDGGPSDGIFCMARYSGGEISAQFWGISVDGAELLKERIIYDSYRTGSEMPVPSSGDLDGDGSDEMVVPLNGKGVIFWNPYRNRLRKFEIAGPLSPAALADVNGDGMPETAVRGDEELYLFSGEGILENNWPVIMGEEGAIPAEDLPFAQPLIADVDGDGRNEVVCSAGGGIHAFELEGTITDGFPLPGSGESTPLIFTGEGDSLHLLAAGSILPVTSAGDSSRAVRYSLGEAGPSSGWHMFRNDPGGSSRSVYQSDAPGPASSIAGGGSLICYPNPAEGEMLYVRIRLDSPADINISIINMEGEKVVEETARHYYSEGSLVPFEKALRIGSLAGGVYICLVEVNTGAGKWRETRKFAIVR